MANAPTPPPRSPSPPSADPEARWGVKRAAWLGRRRPPTASSPPARDPLFAKRLQLLDEMLSLPLDTTTSPLRASASGSSSGLLLNAQQQPVSDEKGKAREEEPEIDGGDVIGRKTISPPPSGAREDSERAFEGILTAFRLGRELKEPLPLSLVTKLLYRGWLLDGTIPPGYEASVAREEAVDRPYQPDNYPRPARPHWLEAATTRPPPSATATPISTAAVWAPPINTDSTETGPGTEHSEAKAKLDVAELKQSGWRAEADVASGDDVL